MTGSLVSIDPDVIVAVGCLFVLGFIGTAVLVAGELLTQRRRRRSQRDAAEVVRARLDDVAALPAPDELPRARDLTMGEVRQLRARRHPVPHKRGSRRWGA